MIGPMADLQFGMALHEIGSQQEFRRLVRRVDELGFDVFAAPDHLGWAASFSPLAAAGMVSERLRLRTYVLNIGFWNAALLAREVATLDLLSGGRAELGLGAGYVKAEHDDAGLPWLPHAERVAALAAMVREVRRRLGDPEHKPKPVQDQIPVMVAAMSGSGLSIAAEHAEIIGFSGLMKKNGRPTMSTAAETAERVAAVRKAAGGRDYRSDVLLQHVSLDPQPERVAEQLAERTGSTAEQILDTPFLLIARNADDAAAELKRRHDIYGFDSVTTHQPSFETLGEVIAAYRS